MKWKICIFPHLIFKICLMMERRKKFVQENPYNVGVDCAILMNPQTWVASADKETFAATEGEVALVAGLNPTSHDTS